MYCKKSHYYPRNKVATAYPLLLMSGRVHDTKDLSLILRMCNDENDEREEEIGNVQYLYK